MKKAVILIVLGIMGLVQYIYFQTTPLAYVIDEVVRENMGGVSVVTEIIYHRDWTLGIIGVIIGMGLLGWGIYLLRRRHEWKRS